jgi:hypothetical protein
LIRFFKHGQEGLNIKRKGNTNIHAKITIKQDIQNYFVIAGREEDDALTIIRTDLPPVPCVIVMMIAVAAMVESVLLIQGNKNKS